MTKANRQTTSPHWIKIYSESDRAQIRALVEREAERRKTDTGKVDFDALRNALERVGRQYRQRPDRGTPTPTLSEAKKFRETWIAAIDTLLDEQAGLRSAALMQYEFVGKRGYAFKVTAPRDRLLRDLQTLRSELVEDVKTLEGIAAGERAHAVDYQKLLIANIVKIGQTLFGPAIGGKDGPLVRFMELALRPLLGNDTPSRDALRVFAQRVHNKS